MATRWRGSSVKASRPACAGWTWILEPPIVCMSMSRPRSESVEVSLVMPCLNEEETLGICLGKARSTIQKLQLSAEIVVADNGSTDRSVAIAESFGARVVHESRKGYGSAYLAGFAAARGRTIVMADSDDSYDW